MLTSFHFTISANIFTSPFTSHLCCNHKYILLTSPATGVLALHVYMIKITTLGYRLGYDCMRLTSSVWTIDKWKISVLQHKITDKTLAMRRVWWFTVTYILQKNIQNALYGKVWAVWSSRAVSTGVNHLLIFSLGDMKSTLDRSSSQYCCCHDKAVTDKLQSKLIIHIYRNKLENLQQR